MSTEHSTLTPTEEIEPQEEKRAGKSNLQKVRDLGASALGESFEVIRTAPDEENDEEEEVHERFVLKKISRARLRDPERFKQKFDALTRLDHPHLCPYRDLYVGEKAARITRDFVEGLSLDGYLFRPITEEEREILARHTEPSQPAIEIHSAAPPPSEPSENQEEPLPVDAQPLAAPEPELSPETNDPVLDASLSESSEPLEPSQPAAPPGDSHPLEDRPNTLEIPESLLEDSEAADRTLDLIILRLREILPQLIDALEYLHRFRHVHGALKPENILFTPASVLVLTDYGIQSEVLSQDSPRGRYVSHLPPETADGVFGPAADLYSLGSILFEALSGRSYGEDRLDDSPRYLSEILPHCPASWADLIHGLLQEEPSQRLSLEEVRRRLAESEERSVNIPATVLEEQDTLFGRREPLARLTDCAKFAAQRRKLGIAVVEGETGVGKTALVDALGRWASQLGWIVLHGRCFQHQSVIYQGWEEVITHLAAIADDLPEKARRRLTQARRSASLLFPQLRQELSDDDSPPPCCRHTALLGLGALLESISEQRPILICFDDIHWAGHDSIQLLADLAELPVSMRVMVTATAHFEGPRPETSLLWSELATSPVTPESIHIDGFSKQEAREYVLANAAHLTLPQKQRILRKGGFNPLLIDELIHEVNGEDEEHLLGDQSSEAHADSSEPDDLVDRLRTFVEQRLLDLSRPERLVLQLLAIAIGPLSAGLLGRAIARELGSQNSDRTSGEEIAESLVGKRLARKARTHPHGEPEARYVVIHDLCREVIRSEIGRDHHARLCGLIADSIDPAHAPSRILHFEYLRQAGRTEEAARAARSSALTAQKRFAFHQAARLWSWLHLKHTLKDDEKRLFSIALEGSSQFHAAAEILADLAVEAQGADAIDLQHRRIKNLLCSGDRIETLQTLDQSLQELIRYAPASARSADLGFFRQRLLLNMNRWSDVLLRAPKCSEDPLQEAAARLLDFSLQASPYLFSAAARPLSHRYAQIAFCQNQPGMLGRDRLNMISLPFHPFLVRRNQNLQRWRKQAQELFESSQDFPGMVRAFEVGALLAMHQGAPEEAQENLSRAASALESAGHVDSLLLARLQSHQIHLFILQGDLPGAGDLLRRLTHRFRHHPWLSVLTSSLRASLHLLKGDFDRVEAILPELENFVGDDKNCLFHLSLMELRTRLHVALGRPDVAVAQWDLLIDTTYSRALLSQPEARHVLHRSLAIALASLAGRQDALGEPRKRETLRRLDCTLRSLASLQPWMSAADHCQLLRLRARRDLLKNRPQRALRSIQKAEALSSQRFPLVKALNQEVRGFLLKALEDPQARTHLEESRKTYKSMGFFLPLLLEAWPVPRTHSLLKEDP